MDARLSEMDTTPARPFRVGALLIDGFALMSYAAVAEPLRAANLLARRELYALTNVPAAGSAATSSGGAVVPGQAAVGGGAPFDLLLVVAGGDPAAFGDRRVLSWLRRAARAGVTLGGVSGGPVILARAGLMTGRRMTVHWEHAAALAAVDPALMLERSLYVIDRDRVTCAGGTAPIDLMHALIAMHHGVAFARLVSDWFLHTDIRPSGSPQRAGLAERHGTSHPALLDALAAMEDHVADPLDLRQLAGLAGVGVRQLNRLFRELLGRSTMGFYRDLRLDRARDLLRGSTLPMTEIALATGFAGSAHFAAAHARRHGQPPSALRR
jgi:transcriptional regulator GlxA family with amidase domain